MYPHRSTLNTISCLLTDYPCSISNGNKGKKPDSFLCSSLRPVTFEAMTILLGRKWPGERFRHSERWSMGNLEISRIGADIEIKIEICQSEGSNRKAACWEVKTVLLM